MCDHTPVKVRHETICTQCGLVLSDLDFAHNFSGFYDSFGNYQADYRIPQPNLIKSTTKKWQRLERINKGAGYSIPYYMHQESLMIASMFGLDKYKLWYLMRKHLKSSQNHITMFYALCYNLGREKGYSLSEFLAFAHERGHNVTPQLIMRELYRLGANNTLTIQDLYPRLVHRMIQHPLFFERCQLKRIDIEQAKKTLLQCPQVRLKPGLNPTIYAIAVVYLKSRKIGQAVMTQENIAEIFNVSEYSVRDAAGKLKNKK